MLGWKKWSWRQTAELGLNLVSISFRHLSSLSLCFSVCRMGYQVVGRLECFAVLSGQSIVILCSTHPLTPAKKHERVKPNKEGCLLSCWPQLWLQFSDADLFVAHLRVWQLWVSQDDPSVVCSYQCLPTPRCLPAFRLFRFHHKGVASVEKSQVCKLRFCLCTFVV